MASEKGIWKKKQIHGNIIEMLQYRRPFRESNIEGIDAVRVDDTVFENTSETR